MTTAYFVAALTLGTKDLPSLADLLDESPPAPPTKEEYHKRMRELGLE